MKDVQDWIAVKRLFKNGVKKKKIAEQLGMSRNTVKNLIKSDEEPRYSREHYASKVDPYKKLIREWYLNPKYSYIGTRIFRELKKLGYTNSISPIYRFLKELDGEKQLISKKATVRIETPPGEQAQFDWAEYNMVINNTITKVYCFSIIMAFSRMKKIVFSLTCDGDAIYEAIQELFNEFGGITQELLIDNPKALVLENVEGKEPLYNIDALRMATHLGLELNACAPYRARTKGKVERPFNYIEEQFIKGNSFPSMEALNAAGKKFVEEWCNQKHSTTKRVPSEAFREEALSLLPLPKKHFYKSESKPRKVSLDSLISVNSNKYSVPVKFVDKEVKIRIFYGYRLEVYDLKNNRIATHELHQGRSETLKEDFHYDAITVKTPKSIPAIKRKFTETFVRGSEYFEKCANKIQQPSYHARQFLKLQELYSVECLDLILGYCIDNDIYEIDGIKETLKAKALDILVGSLGDAAAAATESNPDLIRDLSYYKVGDQF